MQYWEGERRWDNGLTVNVGPQERVARIVVGLVLPGYGAAGVLLDGGLTARFDETGSLLLGLAARPLVQPRWSYSAPARPDGCSSVP